MKKIISIFGVCFFVINNLNAQTSRNCKVLISTKFNDSLYTVVSKEATLTFNLATNNLTLKLKLQSLDHEIDTIENFFNQYQPSDELIYVANTGNNIFDLIESEANRNKMYPLSGNLTLNSISKGVQGTYSLLKLTNESQDTKLNIRFSLDLSFNPTDFGIDKKFPLLNQTVFIEIDEAIVNIIE
jgi:polyisoprenoid-binding protein YceI